MKALRIIGWKEKRSIRQRKGER